jgi:glucose dehydrogenase
MPNIKRLSVGLLAVGLVSLTTTAQRPAVDDEALKAANARSGEWITHGRTQDEQRFSPLAKVSDLNVQQLRLAWTFDTGTDRVLEATPLVVDGVQDRGRRVVRRHRGSDQGLHGDGRAAHRDWRHRSCG